MSKFDNVYRFLDFELFLRLTFLNFYDFSEHCVLLVDKEADERFCYQIHMPNDLNFYQTI